VLLLSVSVSASGCSETAPAPPVFDPTIDPNSNGGICLPVNCTDDTECKDCSGGRKVCLVAEKRCIACGPQAGGKTCPAGQTCSAFGDCVGGAVKCPTDVQGAPTGTCASDADCAACSPKFRVCDTGSKKCVGCTATSKKMCQTTDICVQNTCAAACPQACGRDSDCGACGAPGQEAHACFRGECAQCNAAVTCPAGQACDDHGKCAPSCGNPKTGGADLPGSCAADSDCAACTNGTTTCKKALVGSGTCAAAAAGCSDLGKGTLTLPSPFNKVTNTCSSDNDCSGVSADINAGELLRKITGISSIKDGTFRYPMNRCAPIKITGSDLNCGVCVPCKQDADCSDIDIAEVTGSVLGPLGSIAARILLDKVFGPGEKKIHMYCANVFQDYGACVPCSNILSACGSKGMGGPLATDCKHGVCTPGEALAPTCDKGCAGKVCAEDEYCCSGGWDQTCADRVERLCDPTNTCADKDSCEFKVAGWYCSELKTSGSYHCDGQGGGAADDSKQCTSVEYCRRAIKDAVKSRALLGSDGRPQCFNSPQ
jgi:hypothetical protein